MIDSTGMIYEAPGGASKPGLVLGLFKKLREQVGTLKAKPKQGVRFKVRSLDELVDKIRPAANELGLLIYPIFANGKGEVVASDDKAGTYAEVAVIVRVQAIEDGSFVDIAGFGLGADQQDKAGGKAGSYAFKQALIQALLAGGAEDTDDTDTPLPGGPRKLKAATGPSLETVRQAFEAAQDEAAYKSAVALARQLKPEVQLKLREDDVVTAAKARCIPTA